MAGDVVVGQQRTPLVRRQTDVQPHAASADSYNAHPAPPIPAAAMAACNGYPPECSGGRLSSIEGASEMITFAQPLSHFKRARVVLVVAAAILLQLALSGFAYGAMSEDEKIDALVNTVEAHRELRFVRLGSVHTSSEAARMLRTKLMFAGSHVRTVDDFIDHIATATASGSPYYVLYPDGRKITSQEFLRDELKRLLHVQAAANASK
jgi:hypothetical protein